MPTWRLQMPVGARRMATNQLQETVGAESMILVTITELPPCARRRLCNDYNRASECSERVSQNGFLVLGTA